MTKLNGKSVIFGALVGALLFASAPVIADIGDPLIQGKANATDARTTLKGEAPRANLRIIQREPDTVALAIVTEEGTPPLKVNRKARVKNLNADLLDGRHASSFAPAVPRAGTVIEGTFAAGGSNGELIYSATTFSPQLPYPIPQANVHYIDYPITPTAECPGWGEAAEGQLCVYEAWNFLATFHSFGGVESTGNNLGAAEHGFIMFWTGQGTQANVRGSWAHTIPSSAPANVPAAGTQDYPAEIGK